MKQQGNPDLDRAIRKQQETEKPDPTLASRSLYGWVCPKCNSGVAPTMKRCPCVTLPLTVTC